MDPIEEFEFKPLTKGLGFHKKSVELKKQANAGVSFALKPNADDLPIRAPMAFEEIDLDTPLAAPKTQKEAYADLMKALETPIPSEKGKKEFKLDISQPLPRKDDKQQFKMGSTSVELPDLKMPLMPPMKEMPDILERPLSTPLTFEEKKTALKQKATARGASNSPKVKRLQPQAVSVPSAILDSLFVLALSLIFLVSLLLVTGVNLSSVILNTQTDVTTQLSLSVLFIAVMQMYVIVSRSFFGRTLGEWTFDMQMGEDSQHETSTYPLKVLWRSVVTVATGLVVLPILSLIFQRDLAASVTGIQLYRHKDM
jgi:hypothetical protein